MMNIWNEEREKKTLNSKKFIRIEKERSEKKIRIFENHIKYTNQKAEEKMNAGIE